MFVLLKDKIRFLKRQHFLTRVTVLWLGPIYKGRLHLCLIITMPHDNTIWCVGYATEWKYVTFGLEWRVPGFLGCAPAHVDQLGGPLIWRHQTASDWSDQWWSFPALRLANEKPVYRFERWKAGLQTFARETKKDITSRRCSPTKTTKVDFSSTQGVVPFT